MDSKKTQDILLKVLTHLFKLVRVVAPGYLIVSFLALSFNVWAWTPVERTICVLIPSVWWFLNNNKSNSKAE